MFQKKLGLAVTCFGLLILLLPQWACDTDKLPEPMPQECDPIPVYDIEVKPIIGASCAIPDCHDSSGSAPGNFTTYDGMLSRLNNGLFKEQVIDTDDMPLPPGELSVENEEVLRCWIENGFPKN